MTRQEKLELLAKELFDFDWWNYGLDAVSEAESPEWSFALAEELLKKLEEVDGREG